MVAGTPKKKLQTENLSSQPPLFQLPNELWVSMLQSQCSFAPQFFTHVMHNLIQNPNLSSSYLFRAEIFYDSLNDVSVSPSAYYSLEEDFGKLERHMKKEYRPRRCQKIEGFEWQRTWVRRLVPRNPNLDNDLVQTCHSFVSSRKTRGDNVDKEENLIIYLPHMDDPEGMPWYHPAVSALAFLHSWVPSESGQFEGGQGEGDISLHYKLYPNTALNERLQRIALNLITLIHRHGTGQAAGYKKRVHHDQIIPQSAFQNTYTSLKVRYAKSLIGHWVEQTDPAKHVFEDLGIAAFLIELWKEMYSGKDLPGFVDIGCGNGVLVHVLISEGYQGWGFDARRRKTWSTFPSHVQENLKEMILVPEILNPKSVPSEESTDGLTATMKNLELNGDSKAPLEHGPAAAHSSVSGAIPFHNGIFPEGTFVISNHADELTAWTPLLAHISSCPFIAIPCCSHNLDGARFRAPAPAIKSTSTDGANTNKTPSAYASLCAWVEKLANDIGYVSEREWLRIPSTRNAAILGRQTRDNGESSVSVNEKRQEVMDILEREMGGESTEKIGTEWMERAQKIARSKNNGH